MSSILESSTASGRADVLICCAYTDSPFAKALGGALERLSISVTYWTDSMVPASAAAEAGEGKQLSQKATATLVLISPNARKARALEKVADAVPTDQLVNARIFPRESLTPPSSPPPTIWEFRRLAAHLAHLNPATISPATLVWDGTSSDDAEPNGGLLGVLATVLRRPGLNELAGLHPIRTMLALKPSSVSELEIAKMQAWINRHGDDPAAKVVIKEIRAWRPPATPKAEERLPEVRKKPALTRGLAYVSAALAAAATLIAIVAFVMPGSGNSPPSATIAKTDPAPPPPPAIPSDEKRLALLIGINAYPEDVGKLKNPISDVKLVDASLKNAGFETRIVEDASRASIMDALGKLTADQTAHEEAGKIVTVFFYFAGHGIQVNNVSYLVPRDATVPEGLSDLPLRTANMMLENKLIKLEDILTVLGEREKGANIVIIDACRNSPLLRRVRGTQRAIQPGDGLLMPTVPGGNFVGFSTSPGAFSEDGQGDNSPFALAFADELTQPGKSLHQIFMAVKRRVSSENRSQVPDMDNDLNDDFTFLPAAAAAP